MFKVKDAAKKMFLAGLLQKEIADTLNVSENTISAWCRQDKWKEQRLTVSISRDELAARCTQTLLCLIQKVEQSDDFELFWELPAKLLKCVEAIKRLSTKPTVVDYMDVFIEFLNWLTEQAALNKSITPQFLKLLSSLQDDFIKQNSNIKLK
jgi:hypothetical protein